MWEHPLSRLFAPGGFGRLAGAKAGLSWRPSLRSAVPKAILEEWLELEQEWAKVIP